MKTTLAILASTSLLLFASCGTTTRTFIRNNDPNARITVSVNASTSNTTDVDASPSVPVTIKPSSEYYEAQK
ncbi:hypothetical protein [Sigmofec virus UA08Rod_4577]|uniref:Lipoprotein n=1 Tax=Sigmofec virus UA08Rod_4577 TaxID=2929404 RepID=A0A976N143_9VIRU|nr:hypothetical protein [Sigmofec virus UA08Rod_4577]